MSPVLTTEEYWNKISNAVKSRIQNEANKLVRSCIYCTGRPNASIFRGKTEVRRQCEGPSWGAKADFASLDIPKLLEAGYVFRTYDKEAFKLLKKKIKNKTDLETAVDLLQI